MAKVRLKTNQISAANGQYVTEAYAKENPDTTFRQTVELGVKLKKAKQLAKVFYIPFNSPGGIPIWMLAMKRM